MAETKDGPGLLPGTRELAEAKTFAAISTLLPGGLIQNQVVWVHTTDDDRLVVNTEVHRAKHKNVLRDDRATLLLRDEDDPYHYAEVRGRVTDTITGERARAHIDELARKYTGSDYDPDAIKTERVMIVVTPERQTLIDQNRTGEAE